MEDTNPGPILIKAARLIDGNGGSPIKEGAVLIEGDQITAVGSVTEIEPVGTDRIEVLDYGDRTILPGFVDSHVHLIGIGDGRAGDELTTLPDEVLTLQAARNARTHLHSGVTSHCIGRPACRPPRAQESSTIWICASVRTHF